VKNRKNPNLVIVGQKYQALYTVHRRKYYSLLPAMLNRHTSALFQRKGIRLLG